MFRLTLLVTIALIMFAAIPIEAQKAGQNAKISIGTVSKVENIDLKSQAAPTGALVGGMLAYHTTGDKRSSTTKWGRAAAGAVAGSAIARRREGDLSGKLYTIDLGNGQTLQVVSDQTEIRQGDCVIVEEVKDQANVRRADSAACEPEAAPVISSPDVQEEFQEEAAECVSAKEEMLAAETAEQFDLAKRKMDIFCND